MEINLFSLPPPGAEGSPFGNLAVDIRGVPIGEAPSGQAVAKMLGFSDTDSIGTALDEIIQMSIMLNMGLHITGSSIDNTIKIYLDNADPSKPGLPPIRSLLTVMERDLAAGKLGDVTIKFKEEDKTEIKTKDAKFYAAHVKDESLDPFDTAALEKGDADTKEILGDVKDNIEVGRDLNAVAFTAMAELGKTSGGNPWLAGNAMVAFLMNFMELQRVLMQSKVVQGNIELASMELTYKLAQQTADMIMKIAQMNQMMHIAQAVMAGVAMGISIVGSIVGGMGASKTFKSPFLVEMGTIISTMGQSLDKMVTGIVQAVNDIPIAEKEGAKEIIQAIRTLIQRQMEKAGDAFKSNEEMITQLLQTLDKIRDGLQQAVAASLRK